MSEQRDFFVTLSSNASGEYYAQNTLTHFRNKLPKTLTLEGSHWEVGLAEFQAPYNWLHIQDDDASGRIHAITGVPDGEIVTFVRDDVTLEPKRYENIEAFVRALREVLNGLNLYISRDVHLSYDSQTQKLQLRLDGGVSLTVSSRLMGILGFDETASIVVKQPDGRYRLDPGTHVSQGAIDLFTGLHTLWVYSDIVGHRIVADQSLPLLRILAVEYEGKGDPYKNHAFENIHYLPVRQALFQSIEIDIRDSQGKPVPFERGQVIATLHFRPRR